MEFTRIFYFSNWGHTKHSLKSQASLCLCKARASASYKANRKISVYLHLPCYSVLQADGEQGSHKYYQTLSSWFSVSSSRSQRVKYYLLGLPSHPFPRFPATSQLKNEDDSNIKNRSHKNWIWIYPQVFKNTSAVLQGGTRGTGVKYFKENVVWKGQPPG